MSEIDYTQLYIQAELETIAQKTEDILADPDGYECSACCIEGQDCDVGLAVKVERERIIKLLESKLCWCVGQPLNKDNGREELMKHMNCDWEAMIIEYHVALIKGEQK